MFFLLLKGPQFNPQNPGGKKNLDVVVQACNLSAGKGKKEDVWGSENSQPKMLGV